MSRSTVRRAVALTAAVALGLGAPGASAAALSHGGDRPPSGHGRTHDRSDHGAKKAAQKLRQLLREIQATDARLARIAADRRLTALAEELRTQIGRAHV